MPDRDLELELANKGFAIRSLPNADGPAKGTYYDSNGKAYPGLPVDPYSIRHYGRRGLRLAKIKP